MQTYQNDITKYSKLRDQLQTGDVIAFKGNDFKAKAILVGTNSNYSHVGLVVRLKVFSEERVFIAEAAPPVVVLQALHYKLAFFSGNAWWAKLKCSDPEEAPEEQQIRNRIAIWAMKILGKPYDGELIMNIMKNIIFKNKLPIDSQYAFICSEFVASALKEVGLLKNTTANLTPKQIMELSCLEKPVKLI